MRRLLFVLPGVLAVLAVPGPGGPAVRALPGLGQSARVEADPSKEYRIGPEAGPWMILAASYSGPNAPTLARQLALQLRRRDNLAAWVFNKGEEERQRQRQYLQEMHRLCPEGRTRVVRIPEQCAVLIGGFPDMDSATKALKQVKKLDPPRLDLGPGVSTADSTIDLRSGQRLEVNPLAHAFVVPNPTVPQQRPAPEDGPDPMLKKLNSDEPYSLLKCRKPYTLVVKEFQGSNAIQAQSSSSSLLDLLGLGGKSGDLLNAGALQAQEVARVLSKDFKLEAYVLHTRWSSLVCVGGFDSLEDPQEQQKMQQLRRAVPRALGPVELFAQPVPMKVPRAP